MRTCPSCQRTYPDDTDFCSRDGTPLPESMSASASELEAGLAGRFHVLRRLGAGGMGAVFLAEQLAVGNRPVALKVLLRKLLDDPEFLLRFRNEAASTGRIRHPNVVTIYESGQSDDGSPYIAMEYLEGETLRQTLKRRGALPVAECARVLQQVAKGLNSAHKLGILHRDLKPDNIFLAQTDDGEVVPKVMDFGLAKLRESATHTLTGTVLGTPAYMSPEQAMGMKSEELDARSDIYALGITAYEMLTGRVPFHSDTPIGYLAKHIMEEAPLLRTTAPGLLWPPELERVISKALAKDRDQRHASVLDFANEFVEAASHASPDTGQPGQGATASVELQPGQSGSGGAAARGGTTETPADSGMSESPTTPLGLVRPQAKLVPPAQGSSSGKIAPAAAGTTPRPASRAVDEPGAMASSAENPPPAAAAAAALGDGVKPLGRGKYLVGGALVVLAAIAGGFWYVTRSRPSQPAIGNLTDAQTTSLPAPASTTRAVAAPIGMIPIPGGTFVMGRDNAGDVAEAPAHSVTVRTFYLDELPVTNTHYAEFVRAPGRTKTSSWTFPASQGEWPATGVSWQDARAYCEAQGERLPTEAEWEYAARGTDGRLYSWGNEFNNEMANSKGNPRGGVEAVGLRRGAASPFGVLDMSGNVWQWVGDDYQPYPGGKPGSAIPPDAKVIRGGSFQSDKDHVTATARGWERAGKQSPLIGFRCARSR